MVRTISTQWAGDMSLESIGVNETLSMSKLSLRTFGTLSMRWVKSNGSRHPVEGFSIMPMVPPV